MSAFRLILLTLAGFVLIAINDWEPLDRIVWAGIVLIVIAWVWGRTALTGLAVERAIPRDRLQVGEALTDRIIVRNRSVLPRLWVEVWDESTLPLHWPSKVVNIGSRGKSVWETTSVCVKRGKYQIGPLRLGSGDPFGLFQRTEKIPGTIDVTVLPPEFPIERFEIPAGTLTGSATREQRTPFSTPSVASVREYVSGDAYNRISWTASARLGQLMVKEFDTDPTSDLWIVVDLDTRFRAKSMQQMPWNPSRPNDPMPWLDTTDDYAVAAAASIARVGFDQGRAVGLITNGRHPQIVPAERGIRSHSRILELLAVAESDGVRPLAELLTTEWRRFNRHAGLVIITPTCDPSWLEALGHLRNRNVHATVVHIDAGSFGAPAGGPIAIDRLAADGVASYQVRFGEDIGLSLAQSRRVRR